MSLARSSFIALMLLAVLVACQPADTPGTLAPNDTPQPPTATNTAAPPTHTPTPTEPVICDENAPDPPASAYITEVDGYPQAYSLSCEARSAADLAAYWDVVIEEGIFYSQLPRSENPDVGFVGYVSGAWGEIPPNSYGVHAEPVASLMRGYGMEAVAHKGLNFRCLQLEIAAERPVLIWLVGHAWLGLPVSYVAPDGAETIVAPFEHTMILIGYDEDEVYLVDAFSGDLEVHSIEAFLVSWAALGNMAITVTGADPSVAAGMQYTGGYYEVQYGDSLLALANAWEIPWDSLAALNGITYPFSIIPGQILKTGLPASQGSYPTPTPTTAP
jgi:uncharacterized protein YvpB